MKKFMKITSAIAAVVTAFSLTACGKPAKLKSSLDTRTVATINGEEVTFYEYQYVFKGICEQILASASSDGTADNNFWNSELEEGKTALEVAKEATIEQIAQLMIARQEALADGLSLDDSDKETIQSAKASFITNVGGEEAYKTYLKDSNVDEAYHDDILQRQMYGQKLMIKLADEGVLDVNEEDIKKQVSEGKIIAKHILVSSEEIDVNEAKKKAQEILNKIKNGEDFDTLMKENSDDPGLTQYPDGYFFGTGEMVPEFETAAFALQENQVSELVQTDYGFHIIKRLPLDENNSAYQQAYETGYRTFLSEQFTDYINGKVAEAKIDYKEDIMAEIKTPDALQENEVSEPEPETETKGE